MTRYIRAGVCILFVFLCATALAQDRRLPLDYAWSFSDGLARAEVNGRLGYVNPDGEYLIQSEFRRESVFYPPVFDFHDGRAHRILGDRHGFIDRTGALVIDPRFDDARDFSEGLAMVKTAGLWGYIDTDGAVIIPPAFEEIGRAHV